MKKDDLIDRDIQIALADIERHKRQVASECIKVWDSMEGRLLSFEGFSRMYMQEKMGNWIKEVRWN